MSLQLLGSLSQAHNILDNNGSLSRRQQIETLLKSKTVTKQNARKQPLNKDISQKSYFTTMDYQNLVSFRGVTAHQDEEHKITSHTGAMTVGGGQINKNQLLMNFNDVFVKIENQLLRQSKSDFRQKEESDVNNIPPIDSSNGKLEQDNNINPIMPKNININEKQHQQDQGKSKEMSLQNKDKIINKNYKSNSNQNLQDNMNFIKIKYDIQPMTQNPHINQQQMHNTTAPLQNIQNINNDNLLSFSINNNNTNDNNLLLKSFKESQSNSQQNRLQTAQFDEISRQPSENQQIFNNNGVHIQDEMQQQQQQLTFLYENLINDEDLIDMKFTQTPQPYNNHYSNMLNDQINNNDDDQCDDDDQESENVQDSSDEESQNHNQIVIDQQSNNIDIEQSPICDEINYQMHNNNNNNRINNINNIQINISQQNDSFDNEIEEDMDEQCNHIDTQEKQSGKYRNITEQQQQLYVRQDLRIKIDDSFNSELIAQAQLIPTTPVHTFGNLDMSQNRKTFQDSISDKNKIMIQLQQEEMVPKSANITPITKKILQKIKLNIQHNQQQQQMQQNFTTSSLVRDEQQVQQFNQDQNSENNNNINNNNQSYISPGMKQQKKLYEGSRNRYYLTTSGQNYNNKNNYSQDLDNIKVQLDFNNLHDEYNPVIIEQQQQQQQQLSRSCNFSPNNNRRSLSPYDGTFIHNPQGIINNSYSYQPQQQYHNQISLNNQNNSMNNNVNYLRNTSPIQKLQQTSLLSGQFNKSQIFTPSRIVLNQQQQQQQQQNYNNNQNTQHVISSLRQENHMLKNDIERLKQQQRQTKNLYQTENDHLKAIIQRLKSKQENLEFKLKQANTEKMNMQTQIKQLEKNAFKQSQTIQLLQNQLNSQFSDNNAFQQQQQQLNRQNQYVFQSPIKMQNNNDSSNKYRSNSQPRYNYNNKNQNIIFDDIYSPIKNQMKLYGPTDPRLREQQMNKFQNNMSNKQQDTISYLASHMDEMISDDNDFYRKPRESIFNSTQKQKQYTINPEENYITVVQNKQIYNNTLNNNSKFFQQPIINQMKRGFIEELQQNRSRSRSINKNEKNQSVGVSQALQWNNNNDNNNNNYTSSKSFSPSRVEADEFDSASGNGNEADETNYQSHAIQQQQQNQHTRQQSYDKQHKNKGINVNQVRELPVQRSVTLFSNIKQNHRKNTNNMNRYNNYNQDSNDKTKINTHLSPSNYVSNNNGVFDSNEVIDIINPQNTSPVNLDLQMIKTNSYNDYNNQIRQFQLNRNITMDNRYRNKSMNNNDSDEIIQEENEYKNLNNKQENFNLLALEQRRDILEREYSRYLGQQRSVQNKQKQQQLESEMQQIQQNIHKSKSDNTQCDRRK